jgi:hypothetical protein
MFSPEYVFLFAFLAGLSIAVINMRSRSVCSSIPLV